MLVYGQVVRCSPQLGEDARFAISGHLVHAEVTDLHAPCNHRSGRFGDEEGLIVRHRKGGVIYLAIFGLVVFLSVGTVLSLGASTLPRLLAHWSWVGYQE